MEAKDGIFDERRAFVDARDVRIQRVEKEEEMEVKVVAVECLVNSFVGIYDIVASDVGVSERQWKVLELLAIARRNLDVFAWKPADMTGVPMKYAPFFVEC
ncbi:hypothetical protein Tco_0073321 [Tanacetum coccineum]